MKRVALKKKFDEASGFGNRFYNAVAGPRENKRALSAGNSRNKRSKDREREPVISVKGFDDHLNVTAASVRCL
jgi:hypothetical protein